MAPFSDWVTFSAATGAVNEANRGICSDGATGGGWSLSGARPPSEAGPDPAVDHVVRWRRVDLRRVIAKRFGVELHERTVGKVLHRLGFAKLSVRPKHPRSDPAAQAEWGGKLQPVRAGRPA